jgi:transposase-like protein
MLHKYRRAMALAGREKLSGIVEVDETAIGGKKSGKPGRGAAGKARVAIAVELKDPKGFGRVRLRVIPDYSAKSLAAFLKETVEEGSTIVTDDWKSYPPATRGKYTHIAHNQSASTLKPRELLPGVHRIASLLKRWILGTFQGSVSPEHLPSYLDEFTFRFNRRGSEARGMLFFRLMGLAANAGPVTYKHLVKAGHTGNPSPEPPSGKHRGPRSLAVPEPSRPWRMSAAE